LMASFLGKGFKSAPADIRHRLKPECGWWLRHCRNPVVSKGKGF
jgi:hypothetical protein